MKLVASVQLKTNDATFAALRETLHESNRCANWLSQQAWDNKIFAQFKLHKLAYAKARSHFPALSAQIVVRCIANVSDSYKLNQKTKHTFKLNGAVAYDLRILRWYVEPQIVSIWTVRGRLKIPFVCGPRQKALLMSQQGQSDLILRGPAFYLAATCNIDNPEPIDIDGVLGCDLGVTNILTDSTGKRYNGAHIRNMRCRHRRLRSRLQRKGTKAAKRRLRQLSGKESRFAKDINHCISKQVVTKAQCTKQAIALENLKGICCRIKVRKEQRAILYSWAFSQLRLFIAYKAQRVGIPVFYVDPRDTSCTCFECLSVTRANRPNQATFQCRSCGHTDHADTNAAKNIGRAASVNQPNIANCGSSHDLATSPVILASGS